MNHTANPFTTGNGISATTRTPSQTRLQALLANNPMLWRGCEMAGQGHHGQSTGHPGLDAILPGRGWPRGGLAEVVSPQWGMGELQLLLPLMRTVIQRGQWVLCIAPPYRLYGPALNRAGIDTRQVLLVRPETSVKDALWSMEKALQTEHCGLVMAWQNWLPHRVLRRLQLAAEAGTTLGVIFQRHVSKDSPCTLRLQIRASQPRIDVSTPTVERTTEVTVLRARGNFRPLSARLALGT